MTKPTDQQLYESLLDIAAELESFWDVPGNCPTMKRLKAVTRVFKPVDDVQQVLDTIREERLKRVNNTPKQND